MTQHFSIEESLKFGWKKTREHSELIFKVLLTILATQIGYSVAGSFAEQSPVGVLAAFVFLIMSIVFGVGFTYIALKIAKGEKAVYHDIIPPAHIVWRYMLAGCLSGVAIIFGLILFIVPGIYLALRYMMVRFAILEGNTTVEESLMKSAEMTEGVKWHLLAFLVIVAALNIVGMMLFFVGLLITVPVTLIAYAHIYLKLKNR